MGQDVWEEVSYLQSGKNRREVMETLLDAGRPMTPKELADELGIVMKSASRAVRQLHERGMVECVNPGAPRDRRYRPTENGRDIQARIEKVEKRKPAGPPTLAEPTDEYSVPASDDVRNAVSHVQASRNRSVVLTQLVESEIPLTPSELSDSLDIGFNSVSRALRQLDRNGLVRCVTPEAEKYRRYEPSEKGRKTAERI